MHLMVLAQYRHKDVLVGETFYGRGHPQAPQELVVAVALEIGLLRAQASWIGKQQKIEEEEEEQRLTRAIEIEEETW